MCAGWYPFHCPISVSFFFSTFLCLAASWRGGGKNIRTICAEQSSLASLVIWHLNFTQKGLEGEHLKILSYAVNTINQQKNSLKKCKKLCFIVLPKWYQKA
jgi:hypothetical protein